MKFASYRRGPAYPYKARDGTPAETVHLCDCTEWCGAVNCGLTSYPGNPGDVFVRIEGDLEPPEFMNPKHWNIEKLKTLVDVVSCYVMERGNYLDTGTQLALIEEAFNQPSS